MTRPEKRNKNVRIHAYITNMYLFFKKPLYAVFRHSKLANNINHLQIISLFPRGTVLAHGISLKRR